MIARCIMLPLSCSIPCTCCSVDMLRTLRDTVPQSATLRKIGVPRQGLHLKPGLLAQVCMRCHIDFTSPSSSLKGEKENLAEEISAQKTAIQATWPLRVSQR